MESRQAVQRKLIAALFVIATMAAPAYAQIARGTITGVVKDTSGAVVPDVDVTVTNQQTGSHIAVKTQANGAYSAAQLLAGDYNVAAEHPGFKRLTISGLKLDVGSALTQDLVLEVGQVTQMLEVSGQTSLVETTSGKVGTTITISQVLDMPLLDRNVFNLANLVPGALNVAQDAPSNGFLAYVSLGGGRGHTNAPLLDGIINTRGGFGFVSSELTPSVDAIQEFKVEVNNLSAEYGRAAGGVVNAVTRGGTNQFHGSGYEFLRNDKLDAKGWGNDTKPPLRQNTFGGTIGGPIRKNRTFFFYNYDGLRISQGQTQTRSVGLPEWRKGDFSTATRDAGGRAALVPIYDPDTGTGTFGSPRGTLQFPGNVIPVSRLDPVAVKAVTYLPSATRTPDNPYNFSNNWQNANFILGFRRDQHSARVDNDFTDKTKAFFRYMFAPSRTPFGTFTGAYGPADPSADLVTDRRQNVALNFTHLFSPTFFLTYSMGFGRVGEMQTSGDCCDKNYGQLLGIANVPGGNFPRFNYQGGLVPVTQIGEADYGYRWVAFTNTDFSLSLTKIHGSHALKFGGQHTRFNGNELNQLNLSPSYGFDGHFTQGVNTDGSAVANTGVNLADFLLGRMNTIDQTLTPTLGKRIQYYAGYIQDDWRVNSRLTLNLGVRYEVETPAYEVNNRMSNFDPSLPNPLAGTGDIPAGAKGVVTFAGRNGNGKYLWRWDKNNFAPRFGFAWRVFNTNDTVIRGGYGIFYGNPYTEATVATNRLGIAQSYTARNPIPFRMRDGIPANALVIVADSEMTPTFGDRGTKFELASIDFLDPNRTFPYSQNFNLTIQHQWKGILFEAGYLGNLGRKAIQGNLNLNQIPPALLAHTEINERLRRPFTIFGSNQSTVSMTQANPGISNYNAFTLKVERRYQNGLGWIASYALSKWIDNIPSSTGSIYSDNDNMQNIYNRNGEKALSTNHIPHRLVLAPMYELPFGKGRRWLNRGGALNAVFGGWQVSTLATMRTGSPFGLTVLNGARNLLGDAAGTLRPNQVANGNNANQGSPAGAVRGLLWLDPAAFTNPAAFTYGTASRTLVGVLGPGSVNFDTMAAKAFYIAERWRIQFRWETKDSSNTPTFALPAQDVGGGNLGVTTSASGRRITQFGLKVYW